MKLVFGLIVLCVIETKSDRYTRIKRAKFYSSPPQRFYRRPPISYPIRGAFSYTPPPFMTDEDESHYAPNLRTYKVSKRPNNEGLGDDDISNIIKYLSKQDLDKIVEFAERDKYSEKYKEPFDTHNYEFERNSEKYVKEAPYDKTTYDYKPNLDKERIVYKDPNEIESDKSYSVKEPYISTNVDSKPFNVDYRGPFPNYSDYKAPRGFEKDLQDADHKIYSNIPLDTEESMQTQQFSVITVSNKDNNHVNVMANDQQTDNIHIYTDSKMMAEEQLPKPLNLRDNEDFEVSFTNNVPTVIKTEQYKLENFGDLPLMNYNSKLDTVDSYKVPHYTVTSPYGVYQAPPFSNNQSPPSSNNQAPPLEPAPPVSAARDQSDAHLKAIKIWTHKSKGTAYTLHNDGSLSLERPIRPKPKYGPY